MLLDHDVKTGELLILVVGVHGGLLHQSVQLSSAQSCHVPQPTETVRPGTVGMTNLYGRWVAGTDDQTYRLARLKDSGLAMFSLTAAMGAR